MVNPNSTAFTFSEKIGWVFGKVIRYSIVCGVAIFISGKLGGSKTSRPVLNPPGPTLPLP